jgi:hypothetical protein
MLTPKHPRITWVGGRDRDQTGDVDAVRESRVNDHPFLPLVGDAKRFRKIAHAAIAKQDGNRKRMNGARAESGGGRMVRDGPGKLCGRGSRERQQLHARRRIACHQSIDKRDESRALSCPWSGKDAGVASATVVQNSLLLCSRVVGHTCGEPIRHVPDDIRIDVGARSRKRASRSAQADCRRR